MPAWYSGPDPLGLGGDDDSPDDSDSTQGSDSSGAWWSGPDPLGLGGGDDSTSGDDSTQGSDGDSTNPYLDLNQEDTVTDVGGREDVIVDDSPDDDNTTDTTEYQEQNDDPRQDNEGWSPNDGDDPRVNNPANVADRIAEAVSGDVDSVSAAASRANELLEQWGVTQQRGAGRDSAGFFLNIGGEQFYGGGSDYEAKLESALSAAVSDGSLTLPEENDGPPAESLVNGFVIYHRPGNQPSNQWVVERGYSGEVQVGRYGSYDMAAGVARYQNPDDYPVSPGDTTINGFDVRHDESAPDSSDWTISVGDALAGTFRNFTNARSAAKTGDASQYVSDDSPPSDDDDEQTTTGGGDGFGAVGIGLAAAAVAVGAVLIGGRN